MKKIIVLLVCCCLGFSLMAQDSDKKKKIREVLVLTGSGELGKQVSENLFNLLAQQYPTVDTAVWAEFKKEVRADDMIDMVVPIYEKYFSMEDIEGLITFYKSPLGKKMVSRLPALTQDCMVVGQEWGGKIAEKVLKRLQEKGAL